MSRRNATHLSKITRLVASGLEMKYSKALELVMKASEDNFLILPLNEINIKASSDKIINHHKMLNSLYPFAKMENDEVFNLSLKNLNKNVFLTGNTGSGSSVAISSILHFLLQNNKTVIHYNTYINALKAGDSLPLNLPVVDGLSKLEIVEHVDFISKENPVEGLTYFPKRYSADAITQEIFNKVFLNDLLALIEKRTLEVENETLFVIIECSSNLYENEIKLLQEIIQKANAGNISIILSLNGSAVISDEQILTEILNNCYLTLVMSERHTGNNSHVVAAYLNSKNTESIVKEISFLCIGEVFIKLRSQKMMKSKIIL